MSTSNSPCTLDPTSTVKAVHTQIALNHHNYTKHISDNWSFPVLFKSSIIQPHLKKWNLHSDDLINYRLVSNLHFLSTSEVLEMLVVSRLETHKSSNHFYDPFKSAYRSQHSSKTAILKIHNDIIEGLDAGKCTVLGSLDLSAAFDSVDDATDDTTSARIK